MPNALANETSPYLLQHKENPVDWHPWGNDAIALAKEQQKPIFLSIGYSACHWCHVMEHESFEDERIAKYLNEHFISIKVDREERPDLDQIYMNAVQAMTGSGGWPMSVFLTPDLKPFYGGTYWPPTAGRGMPGFDQVLAAVNDAWINRREEALQNADKLTNQLAALNSFDAGQGQLDHDLILRACRSLEENFDPTYGGFGPAPKFLHTMDLELLLRQWKSDGRQAWIDMVRLTLNRMAAGGIYDHLGGGFARYSVDERWLVPHFEKMLYDNALLAGILAETYAASGEEDFARVCRETLDYVIRDMTGPEGGFFSTEDADSAPGFDENGKESGHKEEGLYYTWRPEEIRKVLGEEEADLFCRVYDVTPIGNFESRNILSLPKSVATHAKLLGMEEEVLSEKLAQAREKLYAVRESRPRPGLDDKIITSWNGLMIDNMARAGSLLGDSKYVEHASRAADFVWDNLRDSQGRLLHTWRHGKAKFSAYLDDYSALACGMVSLYEATFDERRLDQACELIDLILDKFNDPQAGGFFYTASDHEELIIRNKDLTDNATPGGNSLAATALVRLAKLTGNKRYETAASQTLLAGVTYMQRAPGAMGQMLGSLDTYLGPTKEIVLIGNGIEAAEIATKLRRRYAPRSVLAGRIVEGHRSERLNPLFEGKQSANGEPTLYVCEGFACQEPIVGTANILAAIEKI